MVTAAKRDLRLITFGVGPETFVIDIMAVRQIIPYTGSTTVPTAPDFIEGIIVVRNEVIPIVDLRARLYPQQPPAPAQSLVLITRSSAGVIGLKVDDVQRIITAPADALLTPPPLIRGVRGDLLVAVVSVREKVYLLIDLEAVLTAEEKTELREAHLERMKDEGLSR